jgi:hypothetical protein
MLLPRMTTMAALVVGLATSAAAQQPTAEQDARLARRKRLRARPALQAGPQPACALPLPAQRPQAGRAAHRQDRRRRRRTAEAALRRRAVRSLAGDACQ